MSNKRKIVIIVGPTASGKSDLAVKLALRLCSGQAKKLGYNGAEIISADSRQVYKGLDIGTGKITRKEMQGVPHHLLDVADPKKQFSVDLYKKMAEEELHYIEKRGKMPIIVGGTGFYIDAVAGGVTLPDVPPNKLLRDKLEKFSREKLFKILEKKDPRRAKSVDYNNKVRLIRALEIVAALGKVPPLPSPKSRRGLGEVWIGINPKDLEKRIEKRVKKMFKDGLLREIRELKKIGVTNKRLKQLGFEYWQPTQDNLIRDTKRYAKRQMTWFKRNKKIRWYASASSAYADSVQRLAGGK